MTKKVLISGYIGFSNFGDDALLSVLVNHLKEKKCNITALSSNPKLTSETFKINSLYYKKLSSILKGIRNSDIVISGGGNLLQNETSNLSLYYYLFIIFMSKLFGKKVVLFSQGIGPIKGFLPKLLTKLILKSADEIIVRDIYSQRILTKWHIKSKYSYDAVWDLKTKEYEPKNYVGIQLREYSFYHKKFYVDLAKYIDMFFSDSEIKLFSFQNKQDSAVCYNLEKEIKKRNPNIKTDIVLYKNINQISEEFSHLKYLIAMRLHANILGLKYGIKIAPISYSVKVRNLCYEFDIPFQEASEEINMHSVLTELTLYNQENHKIDDARKRAFEWAYIDRFIN